MTVLEDTVEGERRGQKSLMMLREEGIRQLKDKPGTEAIEDDSGVNRQNTIR